MKIELIIYVADPNDEPTKYEEQSLEGESPAQCALWLANAVAHMFTSPPPGPWGFTVNVRPGPT